MGRLYSFRNAFPQEVMAENESSPKQRLDAAHYRRRAQESRELATHMSETAIRMQLLGLSETYSRIAGHIELLDQDHQQD